MTNLVRYSTDNVLEGYRLAVRTVIPIITLQSNTVVANVSASTNMPGGVTCYVENGSQPVPSDDTANFPALTSTVDPSTVGILINTETASSVVNIDIPTLGLSYATMTAGNISLCGDGATGITENGNIAFVVSCVGLQLTSGNFSSRFPITIQYIPNGNVIN